MFASGLQASPQQLGPSPLGMADIPGLTPGGPMAGFEALNEPGFDIFQNDIIDVNFSPVQEGAITLSGADLERFQYRLRRAVTAARGNMWQIHQQAKRDREVYLMLPREPEYEGGPDVTTPLSANKTDGVIGFMKDAVEQRPMASFTAEGVGQAAEDATAVAPICEAWTERELNKTGSRERFAGDLIREANIVGTGLAPLSVTEYHGEPFIQVGDVIRLENFYVDRLHVTNLKDTFCFYEFTERYYNLEEAADRGLYDPTAVESLRGRASNAVPLIAEEEYYQFFTASTLEEENTIFTLLKAYMRFRPEGERRSVLYECVYHEDTFTLLSVRPNSAGRAFDAPPIIMQRVGRQAGYLFGRGIVARLESEQKMADNAINNHLAINNLAASPPFVYRENSPFGRALATHGRAGIMPGMGIPSANTPDKGDVAVMDMFRNPGQGLNDVQVAFGFADRATYTEEAIGSQSDPRKTLGQFQVEVQKGTIRLRVDLADYAYDAATSLKMYWAMMVAYKLDPFGVVEVNADGKLLGSFSVQQDELEKIIAETLYPLFASGQVTLQDAIELESYYDQKLTNGTIPSARRDDLTISLTGTKIIADKIAELQMLEQLTKYITALLPAAGQDSYINYHLRSIITAMGFKDVDKRMPADPGKIIQDANQRMALVQMMNELQMRSTIM